MPNVKIFVDEAVLAARRADLVAALEPVRSMLCRELRVETSACQFAILGVLVLPDQPAVNVEMQIMPAPDRTRSRIIGICEKLREIVGAASGGARVAVRVAMLDPETYVALK